MTKSIVIDYDFARRCYDAEGDFSIAGCQGDARYRPAYLVTNEDLRESLSAFGGAPRDVLTVAASGDQPLFYAAYGAHHIDTFDMTYCAKAIMDIKTAAIQKLSNESYVDLLYDVHRAQSDTDGDIVNCNNMDRVLSAMPADTGEFVRKMSKVCIFGAAYGAHDIRRAVMTGAEWSAIKSRNPKPFNFIWTDIKDLHTHLRQKYDVINVSNIFEWMLQRSKNEIVPTLKNLFVFLKPGGYIVASCFTCTGAIKNMFRQTAQDLAHCADYDSVSGRANPLLALRRLR